MPTNKKEYMKTYMRKRRARLKTENEKTSEWSQFKEWLKNKPEIVDEELPHNVKNLDTSLCETVQYKLRQGLDLELNEAYHLVVCPYCKRAEKRMYSANPRRQKGVQLWK